MPTGCGFSSGFDSGFCVAVAAELPGGRRIQPPFITFEPGLRILRLSPRPIWAVATVSAALRFLPPRKRTLSGTAVATTAVRVAVRQRIHVFAETYSKSVAEARMLLEDAPEEVWLLSGDLGRVEAMEERVW